MYVLSKMLCKYNEQLLKNSQFCWRGIDVKHIEIKLWEGCRSDREREREERDRVYVQLSPSFIFLQSVTDVTYVWLPGE